MNRPWPVTNHVALYTFLRPISDLMDDDVNEITINRPGEVIIQRAAGKEFVQMDLALDALTHMAGLIATSSDQTIGTAKPLLSATLPTGERVQIVMPPAVESGQFALAIRRPRQTNLTLDDYHELNALTIEEEEITDVDTELRTLLKNDSARDFFKLAVKARKNILISGGTSSGKTTFCNALLEAVDTNDRIITIEDVREVNPPQRDRLHLLSSKGGQGIANVTPKDLLEASLRLTPDRIFLSELRGDEAFEYLMAANTGHPGAISTIHANSAGEVYDRLALMIQKAGTTLGDDQIRRFLQSTIDVVVHWSYNKKTGRRQMTGLLFK